MMLLLNDFVLFRLRTVVLSREKDEEREPKSIKKRKQMIHNGDKKKINENKLTRLKHTATHDNPSAHCFPRMIEEAGTLYRALVAW
jgi:hypothetical protein